ncbi:diguanylate cyclase [Thiohalorhabdus methylotrophus]|uniref:diguanylate cyclase n=1 Tax=Thiohalorhabdus methylotrophus TaxID=3242694 RepID=A0ABV4TR78_9GAMM
MTKESEEIAKRLAALERDPAYRDHPLMAELNRLAERFYKVERQLRKVSRIGDLLQALLREDNEAFEQAALTDPLTGLPNRRAMQEQLELEAARAEREGTWLVVGMGDVDHFKAVNDSHGHETGDTVLQEVANRLEGGLREYDQCARWGGEEFLVLCPGLSAAQAVRTMERIREAVTGEPVMGGTTPIRVSISFGVAVYQPGEQADDLTSRADVALYEAKRQGRNRSVLAGEDARHFSRGD